MDGWMLREVMGAVRLGVADGGGRVTDEDINILRGGAECMETKSKTMVL